MTMAMKKHSLIPMAILGVINLTAMSVIQYADASYVVSILPSSKECFQFQTPKDLAKDSSISYVPSFSFCPFANR
jgi:hypothetical protein